MPGSGSDPMTRRTHGSRLSPCWTYPVHIPTQNDIEVPEYSRLMMKKGCINNNIQRKKGEIGMIAVAIHLPKISNRNHW